MKILITGATGFVGERLLELLIKQGHELVVTSRNSEAAREKIPFPCEVISWNPTQEVLPEAALNRVEVVINLMGENIAGGRWSEARKKSIYDSRILGTKNLIAAINKLEACSVKKIISASAIGFYGDTGGKELNENSEKGDGYLADLCHEWEKALDTLDKNDIKKVSIRIGLVLGEGGGALDKMLPPFLLGMGGRLGDGKQFMSWIHRDDLARLIIFAAEKPDIEGVLNGTAPYPVSNKDFTKILAKTIKRPAVFPVPALALKILLGEMSEMLLGGQRVFPIRALESGFKFNFNKLDEALGECLGKRVKGEQVLKKVMWVDRGTGEIFDFFSDEKNLEKLTPNSLNFKVLGMNTESIQEGTLIDYKLNIRGVPAKWRSKIDRWEPNKLFVDEQVKGPYKKWYHLHSFQSYQGGTLVYDNVDYQIPGGFIGRVFLGFFIKKELENIFRFRQNAIRSLFHSEVK